MSAVPKKKLCWNCEGNVAKNIDNCPYCGVYLHAAEEETDWNPSYYPQSKTEEIPEPLYQTESEDIDDDHSSIEDSHSIIYSHLFHQLKQDIFPILFLMMGSIFFLFGIVLLLFSQNGTFTLQWQEKDGLYFLLFAIPLIGFGWMFFQRLDAD